MLLKHINIACKDLSSSALFYIGLLELDVYSSDDDSIELSDGIVLLTLEEYLRRNALDVLDYQEGDKLSLEFEILSFDKFLYKLYKLDYRLNYELHVVDHKRVLTLHDPDNNLINIREADNNRAKLSYEPELMQNQTIKTQFVDTIIFKEKK